MKTEKNGSSTSIINSSSTDIATNIDCGTTTSSRCNDDNSDGGDNDGKDNDNDCLNSRDSDSPVLVDNYDVTSIRSSINNNSTTAESNSTTGLENSVATSVNDTDYNDVHRHRQRQRQRRRFDVHNNDNNDNNNSSEEDDENYWDSLDGGSTITTSPIQECDDDDKAMGLNENTVFEENDEIILAELDHKIQSSLLVDEKNYQSTLGTVSFSEAKDKTKQQQKRPPTVIQSIISGLLPTKSHLVGNIYEESMEPSQIYLQDNDNNDNVQDNNERTLSKSSSSDQSSIERNATILRSLDIKFDNDTNNNNRKFDTRNDDYQSKNDDSSLVLDQYTTIDILKYVSNRLIKQFRTKLNMYITNSPLLSNETAAVPKTIITTATATTITTELLSKIKRITQSMSCGTTVAVVSSTVASLLVRYETQLRNKLTKIPNVYGQIWNPNTTISNIYQKMCTNNNDNCVMNRCMKPKIFFGTHATLSSALSYLSPGPSSSKVLHNDDDTNELQFREIITIPSDGATIAIDWEIPSHPSILSGQETDDPLIIKEYNIKLRQQVLNGNIQLPIILVLHGINNDTSFGYFRTFMRKCTIQHNWIVAGMNFRGCSISMSTPRAYTGAYTGDIRSIIQLLQSRLANKNNVPIVLVGFSLGGNLIAKYLGEEGYSNTLPQCVIGGVAIAQAMTFNTSKLDYMWSTILALGTKRSMIENYNVFKQMNTFQFKEIFYNIWKTITITDFEKLVSPIFIRNNNEYPYEWTSIGYECVQDYWDDAASNTFVQFIPVPLLQLISKDDFLIYPSHQRCMNNNIANPNVLVIETECGGHLGWQEEIPKTKQSYTAYNSTNKQDGCNTSYKIAPSNYTITLWEQIFGSSWSDEATIQFIEALIETHTEKIQQQQQEQQQQTLSEQRQPMTNSDDPTTGGNQNGTSILTNTVILDNSEKEQKKQLVIYALRQATLLRSRL